MKTGVRYVLPRRVVMAYMGLVLVGSLGAQTFNVLHTFTAEDSSSANSDGGNPGPLTLSSNKLYGMAENGGSGSGGTVFAINTDGTGFTTLYNFPRNTQQAGLVLAGNTLYGTTGHGGLGWGTVFAVNMDGTGYTTLYSFTGGTDGLAPAGLILLGNRLYGIADGSSGQYGPGTVFAINTDGTGFTTLYSFTGGSDGNFPIGLVLVGNTLYGTTWLGGSGDGTVFAVNTDGTGFTVLHTFTGSDGANPYAGLILAGSTLYGTTVHGGPGDGTVFAINTDGTGFTVLHTFTGSEGVRPQASLTLSGNVLYGTTCCTVFAINTDGTGFTTLYTFTAGYVGATNSDGVLPLAGLILAGNTLYGTAASGGAFGNGTVFSLSFPPRLSIVPSGGNAILTWPTNYAGFDYTGYTLQSTTNLGPLPAWTTVSPAPVVVNGQNTVTNLMSGARRFYRLTR